MQFYQYPEEDFSYYDQLYHGLYHPEATASAKKAEPDPDDIIRDVGTIVGETSTQARRARRNDRDNIASQCVFFGIVFGLKLALFVTFAVGEKHGFSGDL